MRVSSNSSTLVVPPFECAWLDGDDFQFSQPGKGCVEFEARAENDVTIVLKEARGAPHYRTDTSPNYTVVFGSHVNRQLRIAVNGATVAASCGPVLGGSSFEKFWVDVNKGVITVGRGNPGSTVLLKHLPVGPDHLDVKFVGLCSWDKHVEYRNVSVQTPLLFLESELDESHSRIKQSSPSFLRELVNNDLFADLRFVVGMGGLEISAHRALLNPVCSLRVRGGGNEVEEIPAVVRLTDENHSSVLLYALEYIYTGSVTVPCKKMNDLISLAAYFGANSLEVAARRALVRHQEKATQASEVDVAMVNVGEDTECVCGQTDSVSDVDAERILSLQRKGGDLYALYRSGEYSDVRVIVGEGEEDKPCVLRAHRVVLCGWSTIFAAMLSNGMKETESCDVVLKDVPVEAMKVLLFFMYVGRLPRDADIENLSQQRGDYSRQLLVSDVSDRNSLGCPFLDVHVLIDVLYAADFFCVEALKREVCSAMTSLLNKESAVMILEAVSRVSHCPSLRDACLDFCAASFEPCWKFNPKAFQALDADIILAILTRPDLSAACQEQLLEALVRKKPQHGHVDEHSAIVGADEFVDSSNWNKEDNLFILMQSLLRCLCLSPEGSDLLVRKLSRSFEVDAERRLVRRTKAKSHPSRWLQVTPHELLYVCDGDHNGVCYFSGTSYGRHPWMNPVLLQTVKVSASSPSSRYTDPKALLSGNFVSLSVAGPASLGREQGSWWLIDLCKARLICNYYTIRQDGSSSYMRSWVLEASANKADWVILSRHEKECSVAAPGQYASWPVEDDKCFEAFRYFRLRLTGPTSTDSSNLHVCYFELYGYLIIDP